MKHPEQIQLDAHLLHLESYAAPYRFRRYRGDAEDADARDHRRGLYVVAAIMAAGLFVPWNLLPF